MSIRVGIRHMGRTLGAILCPKPKYIECSTFSTYNLCTMPVEELTSQPASTYVLCIAQEESITASPTSDYSLVVV